MDNKELLRLERLARIQKSIEYSDLATGGKLSAEDADAFITYLIELGSGFFNTIQTIRMLSETRNIDIFDIPHRQIRKKDPGVAPADYMNVSFTRNILTAIKTMLPIEIEEEVFEENIEGEGFSDTLMKKAAIAYGNDLFDLGWNGDEASIDPFLLINDGWIKKGLAVGNVTDAVAVVAYADLFHTLLEDMPQWFVGFKSMMKYYVSPKVEGRFRKTLSGRATGLGDAYLDKDRRAFYQGVIIEPLPVMPDGYMMLTYPKNLVFGIEYGMSVKTDEDIFRGVAQIAMTTKNDFQFALNNAVCIAKNVPLL